MPAHARRQTDGYIGCGCTDGRPDWWRGQTPCVAELTNLITSTTSVGEVTPSIVTVTNTWLVTNP